MYGKLTVDCTIEHNMSSTERVLVDSGTHAGSHVPVAVLCSIVSTIWKIHNTTSTREWRYQARTGALGKAYNEGRWRFHHAEKVRYSSRGRLDSVIRNASPAQYVLITAIVCDDRLSHV